MKFLSAIWAIVIAIFACPAVYCDGAVKKMAPDAVIFADMLNAMIQVESGGDPDAIGDGVLAVGVLQIHEIYLEDVNRIVGEHRYISADRFCPVKSMEMVTIYVGYYCRPSRLGRQATLEDYARCHNGGPNGWRNDPQWFVDKCGYTLEHARRKIANTKAYWEKVSVELQNLAIK